MSNSFTLGVQTEVRLDQKNHQSAHPRKGKRPDE